jgi:succinate-acetate transporter protein
MGWRGAGGLAIATTGDTIFFGGVLLIFAGLLEWLLGNTFPFVVFCSYGAYFLTYGVTFIPYYNAYGAYSPDPTKPELGLSSPEFFASFGIYPIPRSI